MSRIIQGWVANELVTPAIMQDLTSITQVESFNTASDVLPCIYNGLTLSSQTGSQGEIVVFTDGTCRCLDIDPGTHTYLPTLSFGAAYAAFIDINASPDANSSKTLTTSPTTGYIVATYSISPTTPGAAKYTITGTLLQIGVGSYDPTLHVILCTYNYSGTFFDLNFDSNVYNGSATLLNPSPARSYEWDLLKYVQYSSTFDKVVIKKVFNPQAGIYGFLGANFSTFTGVIGENIKKVLLSPISLTVSTYVTILQLDVPIGVWDATGQFTATCADNTSVETFQLYVSLDNGIIITDLVPGDNSLLYPTTFDSTGGYVAGVVANWRIDSGSFLNPTCFLRVRTTSTTGIVQTARLSITRRA